MVAVKPFVYVTAFIGFFSFVVPLIFVSVNYREFSLKGSYYPEAPFDLAYSFYKYNDITHYRFKTSYNNGILEKTSVNEVIPIFEAPAYALFMGLIWKATNVLTVFPIQIIQILLFAFSCMLLYVAFGLFFEDKQKALLSVLMVPLFLPLTFLISNPVRDVFCFYGSAVLLYLLANTLYGQISERVIGIGSTFIILCQWMRPTVFSALFAASLFLIFYAWFDFRQVQKTKKLFVWLWIMNIVGFWIPYMLYNKNMYGRYFAGQSGQLLLDSMGYTGPNKINPACTDTTRGLYCDACVTNYTIKRFNLDINHIKIGSSEMDDKMKEAFWEWFWKDPVFWFKGLLWRIKKILFLDMTWSFTPGLNWEYYNSFSNPLSRLKVAYSFGWWALLEFIVRRWYVRLFMLTGYMGVLILLHERRCLLLGILISLVAGGISPAILSHPEHRYLTPFYFVYPLCAGYMLYSVFCYCLYFSRRQGKKKIVV